MSRGMQQGKGERMKRRGKQTGAASGKEEEKKQHLTFFLLSSVVLCFVATAFFVDCRQKKLFLTPSTGCVPRRSSPETKKKGITFRNFSAV